MAGLLTIHGTQGESAAVRGEAESTILVAVGTLLKFDCTAARLAEMLPILLEMTKDEDLVLASLAAFSTMDAVMVSGAACTDVVVTSQEFPPAMLAVVRRVEGGQLGRPAEWWKKQADSVNLLSICLVGPVLSLAVLLTMLSRLPPDNAVWEELLAEGIHMVKLNREAEMLRQPRKPFHILRMALQIVGVAAQEPSRHESLLATGVVDALLWTTAHNYSFLGTSLAELSAAATVMLIGKNEGGVTLTREAVKVVLDSFHQFFDQTSTDWRVKMKAKSPTKALVASAKPIVDMVTADANKPHVLQHQTALDDLVTGLLVDYGNPRRGQDGADKLQEACALVLQNLALTDVGKGPLRSHAGVMQSLRKVSSQEGGMGKEARQYASGALFELDAEVRHKAKVAAEAAAAADEDGAPVEHVMLSYNWGHQDVIKRLNISLKARDYAVWIDVEKMQGSTVEAMADAVEGAAVMVYGISKAYKESTNCRLEAQYAFQQQTDMVPVMLEEGYSPNGWLGMLLGVRLWYGFYGSVLASEDAFEGKVEELCRELGDRGVCNATTT
eukprot:COSAG01_NODE_70_length_28755_cov_34.709067_20_plen_556_part_00